MLNGSSQTELLNNLEAFFTHVILPTLKGNYMQSYAKRHANEKDGGSCSKKDMLQL
jgi:hypothetical protein